MPKTNADAIEALSDALRSKIDKYASPLEALPAERLAELLTAFALADLAKLLRGQAGFSTFDLAAHFRAVEGNANKISLLVDQVMHMQKRLVELS